MHVKRSGGESRFVQQITCITTYQLRRGVSALVARIRQITGASVERRDMAIEDLD
jgi:hypothetical protein